jgi:DNA-binding protein YbaB
MLRTLKHEAAQMEVKARQLRQEMAAATVTSTSPDGAVTVTVSPTGALQDISFSDKATNHRPSTLGPLVMKTVHAAQRQAADQVTASVRQHFGSQDSVDYMRQFLPETPPEPSRQMEREPDDGEGSVLRKRPSRGQQTTDSDRPRRRHGDDGTGSLLR